MALGKEFQTCSQLLPPGWCKEKAIPLAMLLIARSRKEAFPGELLRIVMK